MRSEFPFYQSSDPELQGSEADPFYLWTSNSTFVDVTGDKVPDFLNTALTTQLWYRPNLGGGRFGPLEMVETAGITDATGNAKLGLPYALNVAPLPPPAAATNEPYTLAFTNAYPSSGPSAVEGGGSVTMVKFPYRNLDADSDGVADLLDNAPSKPNVDQADGDGDGIGDVVDDQPCGPDADGDGIIESVTSPLGECSGKPLDNCAGRGNSKQENGNARAERANGATTLGDACDPVPHARPVPLWVARSVVGAPQTTTCGTPATPTGTIGAVVCLPRGLGYRTLVGVRLETVGQHASPAFDDVAEGAVTVGRTNFRFCVETTNGSPSVCNDEAFASAALIDSTAPIRALEQAPGEGRPWRRVSVDGLSLPAPGGTLPYDGTYRGQGNNGQSFRSDVLFPQRTWDWSKDLTAWRTAFGLVYPFGGVEDVAGTFAVQAETTAGTLLDDATFGFHPLASDSTKAAANLAVGEVDVDGVSHPSFRLFPKPSEWRVRPVGSVVAWLPLSRNACSPGLPSELCATAAPQSALPLYRHPVPDFVGIVDEDGAIREVGESLAPSLRTVLSSSALVLAASEPSEDVGGRFEPPRVVVLTADAARIQGQFTLDDGVLDYSARAACEGRSCSGGGGAARLASPSASKPIPVPANDSPTVAVYAASLQTVFRLRGGASPELSSQGLDEGTWTTITPRPGALGRVVAATYHVFDHSLWVLDDVGHGWGRSMRLLRVSPFDGTVEEVARFPRSGLFDNHWLVSDHDGRLLVASSSSVFRRHLLVKIRLRQTDQGSKLDVERTFFGKGELLAPPRVSNAELGLVVQRSPKERPERESYPSFPGEKGQSGHLGDCF
jgi:hypothetical protein